MSPPVSMRKKLVAKLATFRRLLVRQYGGGSAAFAEGYKKGTADMLKAADMLSRGDASMPMVYDAVISGRKKADPFAGRITQIAEYPHPEPPLQSELPHEPRRVSLAHSSPVTLL